MFSARAEATEQVTSVNGAMCRVWHAETASGVTFLMYVALVAVPDGCDQSEFERELLEVPAPRVVPFSTSLRSII